MAKNIRNIGGRGVDLSSITDVVNLQLENKNAFTIAQSPTSPYILSVDTINSILTFNGDMVITGSLVTIGNATTTDNFVQYASNNTADILDTGWYSKYIRSATTYYAGMARLAGTSMFALFVDSVVEPSTTVNSGSNYANLTLSSLKSTSLTNSSIVLTDTNNTLITNTAFTYSTGVSAASLNIVTPGSGPTVNLQGNATGFAVKLNNTSILYVDNTLGQYDVYSSNSIISGSSFRFATIGGISVNSPTNTVALSFDINGYVNNPTRFNSNYLTVDNITIDLNTISSTSGSINITPLSGQNLVLSSFTTLNNITTTMTVSGTITNSTLSIAGGTISTSSGNLTLQPTASVNLPGLTASRIVYTDASKNLTSLSSGTATQLLHGDLTWSAVSLTADVSGILPATQGGTGQSLYAVGDILYANNPTTLTKLSAVAVGSVLISNGVNLAPSYSTSPTLTSLAIGGSYLATVPPTNGLIVQGNVSFGSSSTTSLFNVGSSNQFQINSSGIVSSGTWQGTLINPTYGGTGVNNGSLTITLANGGVDKVLTSDVSGNATWVPITSVESTLTGTANQILINGTVGIATTGDIVLTTPQDINTTSNVQFGKLGIGVASTATNRSVIIAPSLTTSGASAIASLLYGTLTASAISDVLTYNQIGISGSTILATGTFTGLTAYLQYIASNNLTKTGTGTITNIYGSYIDAIASIGTNQYGLYVKAPTGGSTNIAIYGDNLSIGTSTPFTVSSSGTVSQGVWNGTAIGLTYGGTNNNAMVASNGGIVYSDATKLQILNGTATANLMLLSGSSAAPSWSGYSMPASVTAGALVYASSVSAVTTLPAVATGSMLISAGTSSAPVWQTMSSTVVTSVQGTQNQVLVNTGFGSNVTGPVTLTLPQSIATTSTVQFGKLGLGVAVGTNRTQIIAGALTASSGSAINVLNYGTLTASAISDVLTYSQIGLSASTVIATGTFTGLTAYMSYIAANNLTKTGTGTITNIYGSYIDAIASMGTNQYGLYVKTPTGGSTNVAIYGDNLLVGTSTPFTVNASGTITQGVWNGTAVGLTYGGTNNNAMVASNGGIVYSDATKLQILNGTATANLMLLSGSSAAPSWSGYSMPSTLVTGDILYASSATVVNRLADIATGSVLVSGGVGVAPAWSLLTSVAVTTLTGTANQVLVNAGSGIATSGVITLTLPQSIATTSNVQFNQVGIGTTPTQALEIGGTSANLFMNSATSNLIRFNANGTNPPAFTSRSIGAKLVLYPQVDASNVDYALGIDGNTLWYSVPQNNSTYSHKWYGGITEQMRLNSTGLGIGTTPSYALHVRKDVQAALGPTLFLENGAGFTNAQCNIDVSTYALGANPPPVRIAFVDITGYTASINFQTKTPSGTLGGGTLTSRMYIDSTGVCIGSTAATSLFNVGTSNSFRIDNSGIVQAGTWQGTAVALAYGGTGGSNTASNGGIVYSDASQMRILAGTASARQTILSGASSAPTWSPYSLPATVATGDLLYASSATAVSNITNPGTGYVLVSGGSVPAWATLTSTVVTSLQGTPNQVLVNAGSGSAITGPIILTTPQDINTTSNVQFGKLGLGATVGSSRTQVIAGTLTASSSSSINVLNYCNFIAAANNDVLTYNQTGITSATNVATGTFTGLTVYMNYVAGSTLTKTGTGTISNVYGSYIDAIASIGTNQYGLHVKTPTGGTTNTSLYTDNLSVGFLATSPPSNGIISKGSLGVGTIVPVNPLSVSPIQYDSGAVTATQTGNTITASSAVFTASMVGSQFIYSTGVSAGTIRGFTSTTIITVTVSQTVASATSFYILYNGLQVDSAGEVGIGTLNPVNMFSVSPYFYATGTAQQSGNTTVTGVGTTFTTAMIGATLVYSNGTTDIITGYTSATSITVTLGRTIGPLSFVIYYTGLQVNATTGNVGVNTIAPSSSLDVRFQGSPGVGTQIAGFGSYTAQRIQLLDEITASTLGPALHFNASYIGRITGAGNISIVPTATSSGIGLGTNTPVSTAKVNVMGNLTYTAQFDNTTAGNAVDAMISFQSANAIAGYKASSPLNSANAMVLSTSRSMEILTTAATNIVFGTNSVQRAIIDTNGYLGINIASSLFRIHARGEGVTGDASSTQLVHAGSDRPWVDLIKGNGTLSAITAVALNNVLGSIQFGGYYNGSSYNRSAELRAVANEAFSTATNAGTYLSMRTTPTGTATMAEVMRVGSSGGLILASGSNPSNLLDLPSGGSLTGAQIGFVAGTAAPANGLAVSGRLYVGSSTGVGSNGEPVQIVGGMSIGASASSTTGFLRIVSGGSANYIQSGLAGTSGSAGPLIFGTINASSEWARFSSSGNFSVGSATTTSMFNVGSSAQFQINSSGAVVAGIWSGSIITGTFGGTGVNNGSRQITTSVGSAGRVLASDASGNASYSTATYPTTAGTVSTILRSDGSGFVNSSGMTVDSAGYINSTGLSIGNNTSTTPSISLYGVLAGASIRTIYLFNSNVTYGSGVAIRVCNSTNQTDFGFDGIRWERQSSGYNQRCVVGGINSWIAIGGDTADNCVGLNDNAPRCGMSCPTNAQIGFASSTTAPANGLIVSGNTSIGSTTATSLFNVGSSAQFQINSSGVVSSGTWQGTAVGVTYGGTGSNLSSTGGTSQVLMQTSTGAAITVAQLAASNLSNGTTGSGSVVLATSPTLITPTVTGDLTVGGNLIITGGTTTTYGNDVLFGDRYLSLNSSYTTNTPVESGLIFNYSPTTTATTVNGVFTAGVAATSNPTVVTTGSATFAAGDIILIIGSGIGNDGIYEVHSHVLTTLTIRGIGTVTTSFSFIGNQFVSGSATGSTTITKTAVSVINCNTSGGFAVGVGSNTSSISFKNFIIDNYSTNQLLYSNASSNVTGLTSGNYGVLISNATGVPSWLTAGVTGQVLVSTTSSTPSWSTLSGIAVTSISGTSNQINASASTGSVTLSLSSTIVTPGTLAVNGALASGSAFTVTSTNMYNTWLGGTQSAVDGGSNQWNCVIIPNMSPTNGALNAFGLIATPSLIALSTKTITSAGSIYVSSNYGSNVGTITTAYGIYVTAGAGAAGTITRSYGGYFSNQSAGTTKIALYSDNLAVGYTGIAPPTNGLIVSGVSYFGASSAVSGSDTVQVVGQLMIGASAATTTGALRLVSVSNVNYIQSGLTGVSNSSAPLVFTSMFNGAEWMRLNSTGLSIGSASVSSMFNVGTSNQFQVSSAGVTTITTSTDAGFTLNQTNNTAYISGIRVLDSNMQSTQMLVGIQTGHSIAVKNAAYFGFNYSSTGSNSNYGSLGMNSADRSINFDGAYRVGIGSCAMWNAIQLTPVVANTAVGFTASQSGYTVTASAAIFSAGMVGNCIITYIDGTYGGVITGYTSTTVVSVARSQTVSSRIFMLSYIGLQIDTSGNVGISTTEPTNPFSVQPYQYSVGGGTAQQSASVTVVGVGTTFTAAMVGSLLVYNDGTVDVINAYTSATSVTVSTARTIGPIGFTIRYTGLQVNSTGNVLAGANIYGALTAPISFTAGATPEAYALSSSSRYAFYTAGTMMAVGTTSGSVVGGALIDFIAYNSNNATNIFLGAVAGSGGSGTAANFVIGRRTGVTSWAESLRVNTSGQLGIGTNNPGQMLEIGGTNSQIYLNSATSNMIQFNSNGIAPPTFTTSRSVGTKLILFPQFVNGTNTDYAIGIENNTMWFSVTNSAQQYKWYGGITEFMRLTSTGLTIGSTTTTGMLNIGTAAQFQVSSTGAVTTSTSLAVGGPLNGSSIFTAIGSGGTTGTTHILGYLGSGTLPTASNLYSVIIDKSGSNSLILGINKNSTTGSIPSNVAFISTYQPTPAGIAIGRGDNTGLPSTADIFVDSAGLVGINNNSPQRILHVVKDTSIIRIERNTNTGVGYAGLDFVPQGTIAGANPMFGFGLYPGRAGLTLWSFDGTTDPTRMYVDTNGNIGMGTTTSPSGNLEVYSASASTNTSMYITSTNATRGSFLQVQNTGAGSAYLQLWALGSSYASSGYFGQNYADLTAIISNNSAALVAGTNDAVPFILGTTNTERMRIASGGNVSIGATDNVSKLFVNGTIGTCGYITNSASRPAATAARIQGEIASYGSNGSAPTPASDDGFLRLSAGGGTTAYEKTFIDITGYSTNADMMRTIMFNTGGVEKMRINNTGVGIGTRLPISPLSVSPVFYQSIGTAVVASQTGYVVTATGGTPFASTFVGMQLVWSNGVYGGIIVSQSSTTVVTVNISQTVSSQAFTVNYIGTAFDSTGDILNGITYTPSTSTIASISPFTSGFVSVSGTAATLQQTASATATGVNTNFTSAHVGMYIMYSDGVIDVIRIVNSTTSIILSTSRTKGPLGFTLHNPGLSVQNTGQVCVGSGMGGSVLSVTGAIWSTNSYKGVINAYSTNPIATDMGAGIILGGQYHTTGVGQTEFAQIVGGKNNSTAGNFDGNMLFGVRQNGGSMVEAMRISPNLGVQIGYTVATPVASGLVVSGSVGIGVSSVSTPYKLDVQSTGINACIRARTTTTGSANEGAVFICRGDQANGYAQTHYQTGTTDVWVTGLRLNDANYHFYNGTSDTAVLSTTGLGIGVTPSYPLDVAGTTNSALFRAGNATGTYTLSQILFGWNNTNTYMHSIRTAHDSGSSTGNKLSFFMWRQGTDLSTTIGTRQVMTLQGDGYVGIGTNAPSYLLHVSGTDNQIASFQNTSTYSRVIMNGAAANGCDLIMQTAGVSKWGLVSHSDDSFGIWGADSASSRFFTISSIGDVGINTTSPQIHSGSRNLAVKGVLGTTNAYISSVSFDGGASVSLYSGVNNADDPSIVFQRSLRFGSASDAAITGYAERMKLTSVGDLGVGTTSPQALATAVNLVVKGIAARTTSFISSISLDGASSVALCSGASTSDTPSIIYQKDLRFATATDAGAGGYGEKMRLTSAGFLGINVAPSYILHVRRDVTGGLGPTFFLDNSGGGASAACNIDVATYGIGANAPSARIAFTDAGNHSNTINIQSKIPGAATNALTSRLFIDSSGNICVGNTSATGMFNVGASNQFQVSSAGAITTSSTATFGGALFSGTVFTVNGPGSSTIGYNLGYFGATSVATAGNLYGIIVDKNSTDSIMIGVNKNTATGSVPSNAIYLSTFQNASAGISIGRGNSAGLPSTSDIFIDSTGRVGIGTTSPTQKLEVAGALELSTNPTVTSDNTNAYFWNQSGVGPTIGGNAIQFMTNGNNARMTIANGGTVGINTTNTTAQLNISATSNGVRIGDDFTADGTAPALALFGNTFVPIIKIVKSGVMSGYISTSSSGFVFNTDTVNVIDFRTGASASSTAPNTQGTSRLLINSGGNVCVGGSTASGLFNVGSTAQFYVASTGNLRVTTSTDYGMIINMNNSTNFIHSYQTVSPNMTIGQVNTGYEVGLSSSTANTAYYGFNYRSSGSLLNYGTMGMFAADRIVNFNAGYQFAVGSCAMWNSVQLTPVVANPAAFTASQTGYTVTANSAIFAAGHVGNCIITYADGTFGGVITGFTSTTVVSVARSQTVSSQFFMLSYIGLQIDSTGRVGVGTMEPTNNFSVQPYQYSAGGATAQQTASTTVVGVGTAFTSAMVGSLLIYNDGTVDTIATYTSATSITVTTSRTIGPIGFTVRYIGLQVASTGYVGIGATSPTVPLDVEAVSEAYALSSSAKFTYFTAGTLASVVALSNGVNSGALIDFNAYNSSGNATNVFIGAVAGSGTGGSAAHFVIGRRTGTTSWAESLRVNSSGQLGIGTNNPSQALEFGGTSAQIYMNSATSNSIIFNTNGVAAPTTVTRSAGTKIVLYPEVGASTSDYALGIEGGTMWQSVPSTGSLFKWYGATTEFMRLTNTGLGIGGISPGFRLEVNGSTATTFLFGRNTAQNANDTLYLGSSTANVNFFLDRANTGSGIIMGWNTPRNTTQSGMLQVYNNSTNRVLTFAVYSQGSSSGTNAVFCGANIGQGVSGPLYPIHVYNASSTAMLLRYPTSGADDGQTTGIRFSIADTGVASTTDTYAKAGIFFDKWLAAGSGRGRLYICYNDSATSTNASKADSRITLYQTQVGIGIDTPINSLSMCPRLYQSAGTAVVASQTGYVVTATGGTPFTAAMVGCQLSWSNALYGGIIVSYSTTTVVTVSISQTISSQAFSISYQGAQIDTIGDFMCGSTYTPSTSVLSAAPFNTGAVNVAGTAATIQQTASTTVVGVNTNFTSAMIGMFIIYSDGVIDIITAYSSATSITVGTSRTKGPLGFTLHYPGLQVTNTGKVGVGTSTPAQAFVVSGNSGSNNAITSEVYPSLANIRVLRNASNAEIKTSDNTAIYFQDGTSGPVYFTGGNVSVGSSSATSQFNVGSSNQFQVTSAGTVTTSSTLAVGGSLFGNSAFTSNSTNRYNAIFTGTQTSVDAGPSQWTVASIATFSPSAGSTYSFAYHAGSTLAVPISQTVVNAGGLHVNLDYAGNTGTITNSCGVFVRAGGAGVGTISNAYGGYFQVPVAGTNKIALYADNLAIGFTGTAPPSTGAIINGNVSIGMSTATSMFNVGTSNQFQVTNAGLVGVNVIPISGNLLSIGGTISTNTANPNGLYVNNTFATTNSPSYTIGVQSIPTHIAASLQTISNACAMYTWNTVNTNVGTITNAIGILVDPGSAGAGTITNAYGAYIRTPAHGTNRVALFTENCAIGGVLGSGAVLTVTGAGSASNTNNLASFTSGTGSTAGNLYSIVIDKNLVESLSIGINKNSVTGAIPANSAFISTYTSTPAGIAIGRGNGAGLPTAADIFINSSGQVGINTTGQVVTFQVNGVIGTSSGFSNSTVRPAAGTSRITGEIAALGCGGSTTPLLSADDGFLRISAGGGTTPGAKTYIDLSGYSTVTDMQYNIVFGLTGAERMRINSTGVGIGTNNPGQKLEIGGTSSQIYLNSATSNMLYYNANGVATPAFTSRSVGTKIVLYPAISGSAVDHAIGVGPSINWYSIPQAVSGNSHVFYAGTTELMRIQGNSYVGIGVSSPLAPLQINTTVSTTQTIGGIGSRMATSLLANTFSPSGFVQQMSTEWLRGSFVVAAAQTCDWAAGLYVSNQYSSNVGTITTAIGVWADSGATATGTITNAYGGYFNSPQHGNSRAALYADQVVLGYTTVTTSGGTTTLTNTSNQTQYFTGTSTHTVTLPVVSTLYLGYQYNINNRSTQNVTVQSSGLVGLLTIPAGYSATFTCILTSGTGAASWDVLVEGSIATTSAVSSITGTASQINASAATGAVTLSLSSTLVTPGTVAVNGALQSGSALTVNSTSQYNTYLQGTMTAVDAGPNQWGLNIGTIMQPTSGSTNSFGQQISPSLIAPSTMTITNAGGLYVNNTYSSNVGTLTNAYGLYVTAGSAGAGTITNAYGGYFTTPTAGTNKTALYTDNCAVGNALISGTRLTASGAGSASTMINTAYFGSGGSVTAGNIYSIVVDKSAVDYFAFGINKNTTTGSIPANACFISSYSSAPAGIAIGRGNGTGLPSSADIFVSSTGTVGFNTTSPTGNFEVYSASAAANTSMYLTSTNTARGTQLRLQNTGTGTPTLELWALGSTYAGGTYIGQNYADITAIISTTATSFVVGTNDASPMIMGTNNTERLRIDSNGNITPGTGALATNATNGFVYEETCAGQPTGVPTAFTGRAAKVYDTTNNVPWVYNGGWVAGNGQVLISKQVLSGTSTAITFNSIPGVFNHLRLVCMGQRNAAGMDNWAFRIAVSGGAIITTGYDWQYVFATATGTTVSATNGLNDTKFAGPRIAGTDNASPGCCVVDFPCYTLTTFDKSFTTTGGTTPRALGEVGSFSGSCRSTTGAITSISIVINANPGVTAYAIGTAVFLYGVY